jgi:pimeloyl-ACP methyl ester carboxylesterase
MIEVPFTVPGGLTLQLCCFGPDTGRPLLVLHGFLEQGAAWEAFAAALGTRVVAPDHRGHGRSDHAPPGAFYAFWDYVSDVDALAQHLVDAHGGPIDLLGHSMGGTIASLFAGTRPGLVRRVVLVEGLGPPDMTEVAVESSRLALDHRRHPPRQPTFPDVAAAADRMRRFNPKLTPEVATRLAKRLVRPVVPNDPQAREDTPGRLTWRWDARHRMRSARPFSAEVHRRYLASITVPTLLVDGADSLFRIQDADARIAAFPDARSHTIAGAGHLIHHDAPEALASAVRAHLD